MPDKVERCPYCRGSYPHQAPTGCWNLDKEGGPGIWSNDDPYIIWKYFIGRDKGPLHGDRGLVKAFFSPGRAWKYIFEVVQPDDDRACENYRVLRISEYLYMQRMQRCIHVGVFATDEPTSHCFTCGRDVPREEL